MRTNAVILTEATDLLLEKLGVIETEIFFSTVLSDRFDYTLWRQEHFVGKMSPEELNEKAAAYAKENHVPAANVKIV